MIEKNIFQSWYSRELPPLVQSKIDGFLKMNPAYKYHLYTDDDMEQFVKDNYPGIIYECYKRLNIIVAKVDLWRYLILYKEGGVYLDMDSSIEKPLDELILPDDEAIMTVEKNPGIYVQWGMIFKSKHPILKRTIEYVVDNIQRNAYPNDIHKMTGPTVISRALNDIHFSIFNVPLEHAKIHAKTDTTYRTNTISYRIYGVDYSGYFQFKHEHSDLLYVNHKHWMQVEREVKLLK